MRLRRRLRRFATLAHLRSPVKLHEIDLSAAMLAQARAGERPALAEFYRLCARPAYTLIRRIVPGPAADDLLQDAFIDAIRGLPHFDGAAPLGAWFRTIVVRRCLMHVRSPWQRSRDWLDERLERSDGTLAAPAQSIGLDLERALERLSGQARLVVWLHDVEGYTHEEIAALTGGSASGSKSQLARAHRRLREWLQPTAHGGAPPAATVNCARSEA